MSQVDNIGIDVINDIRDEGVDIGIVNTINFVGAGVSASQVGLTATVSIPGGGSGIDTEDEGSSVGTGQTILDFVGAGVSLSSAGSRTTITIPGGGGGGSIDDIIAAMVLM